MSKSARKPAGYKTIDGKCAKAIFELHRKHPQLGHDGLLKMLDGEGFRVDSRELQAFLEERKIRGEHWEVGWGLIPGRFDVVKHRLKGAIRIGGKD